MNYVGDIFSSFLTTVCIIFLIMAVGYLLGGISIKGISLGTAGVLLAALAFGVLSGYIPWIRVGGSIITFYLPASVTLDDGTVISGTKSVYSLVSNIGTAMFVTSVGLIAGPKFFRTLGSKSLAYILMGIVIIVLGTLTAIMVLLFSRDPNLDSSLVIGIMTGALTSTPGFSAAKEVAGDADKVTAGYGIGYLFGVLGVVLFVQLVPRLLHADIEREREGFVSANQVEVEQISRRLFALEQYGFFPFALTVVFGSFIGCITIPGIGFSLGASGGMLIAGLIIGHFGHIGPIDCRVSSKTLGFLRELGLCLFLIGAGVPGGVSFIANVRLSYFIYGAVITLMPMLLGFILGKYVFRLSLFNTLGSITGGMTSTPALGALIAVSGTEDVAASYAATYPFALFCVVLASRLIVSVL